MMHFFNDVGQEIDNFAIIAILKSKPMGKLKHTIPGLRPLILSFQGSTL